jgi:hypothetical protein
MSKKDFGSTYTQQKEPPPLYGDDGAATVVLEDAGRDAALKGQYFRQHIYLTLLLLTIKQMTAALTLT